MVKGGLRFIADENISPVLVTILHKLGERDIERISGTPYAGTNDEDWLPTITKLGYICVTCDRKMLYDRGVAQVLIDQKCMAVFFGSHFAQSGRWDQALWLLRYWRKIKKHAETMAPGQLVRVCKNGRIIPVYARPASKGRRVW